MRHVVPTKAMKISWNTPPAAPVKKQHLTPNFPAFYRLTAPNPSAKCRRPAARGTTATAKQLFLASTGQKIHRRPRSVFSKNPQKGCTRHAYIPFAGSKLSPTTKGPSHLHIWAPNFDASQSLARRNARTSSCPSAELVP